MHCVLYSSPTHRMSCSVMLMSIIMYRIADCMKSSAVSDIWLCLSVMHPRPDVHMFVALSR